MYHYFNHVNYGSNAIYRFPANKSSGGDYFSIRYSSWGHCGNIITPENWTRISREQARKKFPKAFK